MSKIERNDDLHLSTLGGYVAALGGRLEVNVVFPDHPEQTVSIVLPGEPNEQSPTEQEEAARR